MGDNQRGPVFALWLRRHFPRARRYLCVAEGKGLTARKLANAGFEVTVIDAAPRLAGADHPRIHYRRATWFDRNYPVHKWHLIVGMHPDEATAEIILAAEKCGRPWAIVPCCVLGPEANGVHGFNHWLRKLRSLSRWPTHCTVLKMSGRNVVLWSRGPGKG